MQSASKPTLIIGNHTYSSWSMRPWLFSTHLGIAFETVRLPMYTEEWYQNIGKYSPTGCVPALHHHDVKIWDTLAIMEYLSEYFLADGGWPADRDTRAMARAISCEMHSGFQALRQALPVHCKHKKPTPEMTAELKKDIARIEHIWSENLQKHGGPWLFGEFSIADAMFAPVASRFDTYGITLSNPDAAHYAQHWMQQEAMKKWYQLAKDEKEVIAHYEAS